VEQCFCVTIAHACGCKVALQPVLWQIRSYGK
jgi:hypothetical protein